MKDKGDVIKTINNYKNKPISSLKSDLLENANVNSAEDRRALMQYNALLDNITIGPHTSATINYAGIDWVLRLLTAEEYVNIRKEVDQSCKDEEIFADYFIAYKHMIKIIARALTPSPFKTEGKAIFSEDDLRNVNYDVLEAVYIQYRDFVILATGKPTDYPDEEIVGLWRIAEKKPEVLRELERPKLLAIIGYLSSSLRALEKIRESVTSS